MNARFLTQELSGVQRYAFEMCLQMKNIFPEIIFLSPKKIVHHNMASQLSARSIGVNSGHLWEQLDLVMFLVRFKDSILINLANTGPVLVRRQVITIHDLAVWDAKEYYHPFFVMWYRWLIHHLVKNALGIFTVSETEKMKLVSKFKLAAENVYVTYNGIASNMKLNPIQSVSKKEKIILYVGAMTAKKNVSLLVEYFTNSCLFDEYRLYLVGKKSSIMQPANFQQTEKIIWLQDLSDEDLVKLYQKAECFVTLSENEGFGIPILEALYYGCKVICADIPVFRELYGQYVYFCNPQNAEEVIARFESLPNYVLPNKNQISHLFEKYNYTTSANLMLQTLQKLCST